MVLAVISSELFWPPFVQPLSVRLSTLFWFHRPRSFRKGGITRWSNTIGHDQIYHEVVILELITSAVFDHLKILELKGSLNTNISNKALGRGLEIYFSKTKMPQLIYHESIPIHCVYSKDSSVFDTLTKNRAPRNGADRGLLGYTAHKNNLDKSGAALQLMIHIVTHVCWKNPNKV